MKRIFSLATVLLMLCGLLAVSTYAAGNGSMSMSSSSGNRGDTVTLSVNLNSNPGLVTMSIRVSYDTSVLQLTNVSNPGLLVGAQLNTSYSSPYTISWVDGATTTNNTKTGTIATFTFKILDNAKIGDSTVTLQFVDSYDTDYNENSFSASSGKVTVICKHSYGNWTKVNDTTHKHTCTVCSIEETASHTWNGGTVTKAATCKETGVKTYTCTGCNTTKTETIAKTNNHTYSNWTKVNDTTHKHTCSVCSKEETASHTWNSGTVTKTATCKEDGVKTYTCTGCNATKTETIAKLTTHTYDHACDTDCNVCGATRTTTHNYTATWSKDSTSHWHECSVCKDKKDIAAHTPGAEPTETTAQICTECGYVIKAALGHTHNYAEGWTSDENGHWHICSGCEDKGSYAAHIPGPNATATTNQVCTECGYVLKEATGETEPTATPTQTPTQRPTTAPTNPTVQPNTEKDDFSLVVIIIVVVVLAGGATAGVILWKKKH